MKQIKEFSPLSVTILDDYYTNISQKMVDFLNTFNPDKLLFNFRTTAGLPNKKASISYGGWENSRIGGHTMGHYLTAAAQALARGYGECKGPDGKKLHERLSYIIKSLAECQDALGTGFIFGATLADPGKPELQFEKLERGDYNDTWVPWYTMHKILAGLVEVHKNLAKVDGAISMLALEIAERLGEWCWRRTTAWTPEVRETVLRVEFGGMNDCLYELYRSAKQAGYKDARHFWDAAHAFDEEWLFNHVEAIVNRHANTTIPKFVGAANRTMLLLAEGASEEAQTYLNYCRNFWDEVVNHHTYITGGNSECEHFGLPDILDAERSNTNCETCNTYNMLKLSRMLFMLTGERKYADYYENTFLNAIMASVKAENAMTTYFQPMATGCFKTYCNPDVDKNIFWCCTGTGLENFTKLGDSFYFYDDGTIYINMYVGSTLELAEPKMKLTQKTDISNASGSTAQFTLEVGEGAEATTLAFRLPDWLAAEATYLLNGAAPDSATTVKKEDGYLYITRNWKTGDTLTLDLPMEIRAYSLQDSAGKTLGFKYGPLVLAAELGSDERMKLGEVGAQCDVSGNKIVGGVEMPLTGNYGGTSNLQILETEIILLADKNVAAHFERAPSAQRADPQAGSHAAPKASSHTSSHAGSQDNQPRFRLKDTDFPGEFIFSPYNRISGQRYGIYWRFVSCQEEKQAELQNAYKPDNSEIFIEGIGVGYGAQTEGNEATYPHMQESNSVADPHELFRYAKAGGCFSYEFAVKPGKQNFLVCTFLKEDNGKTMRITASLASGAAGVGGADETEIANLTLDYSGPSEKYSQRFAIPASLTPASDEAKSHLRIKFAPGTAASASARLCAPVKTVFLN